MAYSLGNKCAKNICKRTVLHQLIIKNVVTCFFWNTVYITINPLIGTLMPHSKGPLYANMVISTLAVDGWAVTFGTARKGLGGLWPRPVPPLCTEYNSPPINVQCTNFILFNAA